MELKKPYQFQIFFLKEYIDTFVSFETCLWALQFLYALSHVLKLLLKLLLKLFYLPSIHSLIINLQWNVSSNTYLVVLLIYFPWCFLLQSIKFDIANENWAYWRLNNSELLALLHGRKKVLENSSRVRRIESAFSSLSQSEHCQKYFQTKYIRARFIKLDDDSIYVNLIIYQG